MKFFNKNILKSIGIVLFLFLIKYSLFLSVNKNKIDTEKPPTQVSENLDVSQETWKTFINKKFSYGFKYPSRLELGVGDWGFWSPIESNEVVLAGDGEYFKVLVERKLNKDLKQYVEQIWNINKSDKNPNFPNRKISNIDSFELAGLTAYKFSATDAFSDFYGSGVIWGGENQFIFLENGGLFFRIQCGIDVVSQKILDTFAFAEKIKPEFSQSKSLTFNNDTYGFSFEYPDVYSINIATNTEPRFFQFLEKNNSNSFFITKKRDEFKALFSMSLGDSLLNHLIQLPTIYLSIVPNFKYTRLLGPAGIYWIYDPINNELIEYDFNSQTVNVLNRQISSSGLSFYVFNYTWEGPQNKIVIIPHKEIILEIMFSNSDFLITQEELDKFIDDFVNSFKLK